MKIRHEKAITSLLLWIFALHFTASSSLIEENNSLNGSHPFINNETSLLNSSFYIYDDENNTNTNGSNLFLDADVEKEEEEEEEEEESHHSSTTESSTQFDVNSGNLQLKITPCEELKDCRNIDGSYCNKEFGICACRPDHPITASFDCFRESKIGEFCHYDVQCFRKDSQSRCDSTLHICQCLPRFVVKGSSSKKGWCVENDNELNMKIGSYVDPALFGIMGGLALMFIIICVVLQLFSRAHFRENRTIFNTPNPRLMNVSLMKDRRGGNMDPNNGRQKSQTEAQNSSEETARVTVESSA